MKKKTVYALLIILIVFNLINNFVVLKIDNIPFVYDTFDNYLHSFLNYKVFIKNPIGIFNFGDGNLSHSYPPLFYWSTLPLFLLFGITQDIAVMTNMIFFAILIFSTYGIGKVMRDEETGLLAAFTVSMFPAIFGFSRVYIVDFLLASMVSLAIYLLIKTENFKNTKYSILLGLALGAGMLSKQTFPFYISFPLLVYLIFSIKKKEKNWLRNLFFSSLIAIAIFSPWYYVNFKSFSNYASTNPSFRFIVTDSFVYLKKIYSYQLAPIYSIILLLSLPSFFLLKNKLKYLITGWLIIPIVFYTIFFGFKFAKYMLPIFPAVAIIIAINITNLKRVNNASIKRVYPYILFLIVCIGIVQFFISCYYSIGPIQFDHEFHERFQEKGIIKPQTSSFDLNNIFTNLNIPKDRDIFVIEMADTPPIDTINTEFILQNFRFFFYSPYKAFDSGLNPELIPKDYNFSDIFDRADIIIAQDKGDFGSEDIPIDKEIKKKYNAAFFKAFNDNINKFILVSKTPTGLSPVFNDNINKFILISKTPTSLYGETSIFVYAKEGLLWK